MPILTTALDSVLKILVGQVPTKNFLCVDKDDRMLAVEAEVTTLQVEPEDTILLVPYDNRTMYAAKK